MEKSRYLCHSFKIAICTVLQTDPLVIFKSHRSFENDYDYYSLAAALRRYTLYSLFGSAPLSLSFDSSLLFGPTSDLSDLMH